jgi:hypothetical protein
MKKSTLILAGIFVVLIIAFLLSKRGPQVERGELSSSLAKLDTLTVSRIQIQKPDEAFTFEKRGEEWMITSPVEYRANQDFIKQMLKTFVELRVEDKRTDNPEKHGSFEVDTTGTEVTFFAGESKLVCLIIGKTSQDYSHTFVRENASPDVYSVKGVLSGQLDRNLDTWRDKTIFQAEKTDITQLALVYPEDSITLYWTGGNWVMATDTEDNLSVDQPTVDQMLNTLSNFRASLFPKEEEYAEVSFEKPDFRLDLTTIDGTTTLRMVEEEEQNRYFVQKEGDPTIFQVYRGTVSNLMKKAEDLKAKEEAPPPSPPSQ